MQLFTLIPISLSPLPHQKAHSRMRERKSDTIHSDVMLSTGVNILYYIIYIIYHYYIVLRNSVPERHDPQRRHVVHCRRSDLVM